MITEEKIKTEVTNELSEAMRHYIGNTCYGRIREEDVVSIDTTKQEIVIKFNYNIVEEDDWISILLKIKV